jgi:hypothetical protein
VSAIDTALVNALKGDATLTVLAPGGVFRDVAPEAVVTSSLADASQVFGLVTLQSSKRTYAFGSPAFEDCLYLVKFVSPSTSPIGAQAAVDRAEVVLSTLAVSGFAVSCSRRDERIAYVESDGPVFWQHRGVSWLVEASPTP